MAGSSVGAAVSPSGASLYVGDLDPSVTEALLYDVFSQFGLLSVRLCRDLVTKNSLCYGYANFFCRAAAEKALKCMNHTPLCGRQMRIMWLRRNPSTRKSGEGNVFVKNLDESVDAAKLEEVFGKFGEVESCKVATEENGRSKGFGFVQFKSQESARSAIAALHESEELGGKKLYVAKFVVRSLRQPPDFPKSSTLFVKNLEENITEGFLRKSFSRFGEIRKIKIVRDGAGSPRGFGFISFEKSEDAASAIETMDGAQIGSKTLHVEKAMTKSERAKSNRRGSSRSKNSRTKSQIFVKNLHPSVDEEALREIFSGCGRIRSAKVIVDFRGVSRGFGFVGFSTPEEASKAVSSLNGAVRNERQLFVEMAKGREEMKMCRPYHGGMESAMGNHAYYGNHQMWMNGYYPTYPYMMPPPMLHGQHHAMMPQTMQHGQHHAMMPKTMQHGLHHALMPGSAVAVAAQGS